MAFMLPLISDSSIHPSHSKDVELCLSYHEHHHYLNCDPSDAFLLQARECNPAFHIEQKKCGVCTPTPFVVVLDTETTGSSKEDLIIQLGYIVYDQDGKEINAYEKIWQCDRPSNAFAERIHGLTNHVVSSSLNNPVTEINAFLGLLNQVADNGGLVVAHNAAFDTRMFLQTALHHGIVCELRCKVFCTVKGLKLRSIDERGVNCKNEDVYRYLLGEPLGRMHTALVDARATAYIFWTGRKKEWW